MLARFCICLVAFFIGISNLQAQEQEFFDDTTQELYSAQTTLFVTVAELKYNQATFRPIFLDITKLDRFTYRQRAGYKLQDLGNDGTAVKPMFYSWPKHLGAHTGFYVYDLYFKDPLQLKYYDAKSPYTDGTVALGNFGSYTFEVCHSRSFNKNWHLGAMFGNMLIDKEFLSTEIPGDRNVITYPFALFGHYKTDNARYQVLASFYRKNHRVRETGGIFGEEPIPINWLKARVKIDNNLNSKDSIETSQLVQQYHLYQQFKWIDELQPYQELSLSNQFNQLKGASKLSKQTINYLGGSQLTPTDSIQETTIFKNLGQEWGVKGDIDKLFYRCYYQHRQVKLQYPHQEDMAITKEHYVGIDNRLKISNQQDFLHIQGAYLWGGLYQAQIAYQGDMVEVAYKQIRHKPSFLAKRFQGTFRKWQKNLKPPANKQVSGAIRINLPNLVLRPYGSITAIEKPIYFEGMSTPPPIARKPNKSAHAAPIKIQPKQSEGYANLFQLGTTFDLTLLAHFHADNELILTNTQGPAAYSFRMPPILFNSRLYYARTLYEGRLDLETGVDLHWHSPYYADGYDPASQQFYLQNQFLIYDYLIADIFFNFRISTFRGFIKVTHLNQNMPDEGYFVTPFYPGPLRSIDVGFGWSFFD